MLGTLFPSHEIGPNCELVYTYCNVIGIRPCFLSTVYSIPQVNTSVMENNECLL